MLSKNYYARILIPISYKTWLTQSRSLNIGTDEYQFYSLFESKRILKTLMKFIGSKNSIDHDVIHIITSERSKDQYFTAILAQKLSNLPISFGLRAGFDNLCTIDWLDAPRQ